jgi:pimeloyl-ACP methyl ester carboxylesterase
LKSKNEVIQIPFKHISSTDGTQIAYYTLGNGPSVILVHGAMETAKSHIELARVLAEHFTVYIYDRRGRGNSSQFDIDQYGVQKEVDDLNALIAKTNTKYLFGISSGAIIVLQTLLQNNEIEKAVIYEPPFSINGSFDLDWIGQFDEELAEGKIDDALITGMFGTQMGPAFFSKIPRAILKLMLNNDDFRELAPTLAFDIKIVLSLVDKVNDYSILQTDILLLNGSDSADYLKYSIDKLSTIIQNTQRVVLDGVGHGGSGNKNQGGRPEMVGKIMLDFYNKQ